MSLFPNKVTFWDIEGGGVGGGRTSASILLLLFSHPVVSSSLWPHGLQHTRPSCPSPSPWVCPGSYSLHWWRCPAISSSDDLFFPQSFPASKTLPMSHLFPSDDQNTGASASFLPVHIQSWSPLILTGLIFFLSEGLSGVFSSTTVWRHQFFVILSSLRSSSHSDTWPLEILEWCDSTHVLPGGSVVKNLPANAGDVVLIPGLGRSPAEGSGNPLQYPCMGNHMDRGAWRATGHEVAEELGRTERLNNKFNP